MKKICSIICIICFMMSITFINVNASDNNVQVNEAGMTYGSEIFSEEPLDLIMALATNGKTGYVKQEDLNGPDPASPSEALQTELQEEKTIPVYEADGTTIIGEFVISPSVDYSIPIETRNASSSAKYFTVNGYSYYNQATIAIYPLISSVQSRIKIMCNTGSVASGWMGVAPRLYRDNGSLVKSAGYTYNSSSTGGMEVPLGYNTSSGAYYSSGYSKVWNSSSSSYATYSTYKSPSQSIN